MTISENARRWSFKQFEIRWIKLTTKQNFLQANNNLRWLCKKQTGEPGGTWPGPEESSDISTSPTEFGVSNTSERPSLDLNGFRWRRRRSRVWVTLWPYKTNSALLVKPHNYLPVAYSVLLQPLCDHRFGCLHRAALQRAKGKSLSDISLMSTTPYRHTYIHMCKHTHKHDVLREVFRQQGVEDVQVRCRWIQTTEQAGLSEFKRRIEHSVYTLSYAGQI